jgi:methionyl-tRNA synthetase
VLIRKLDPASFVHEYNVDLQLLYPWDGVIAPPFGAAWAVLAPGESTKPHAHQECETFFIARGAGEMSIGEERILVEAGDVTFHRPFDNHTLTNTAAEELLFLTVWWEDRAQWDRSDGQRPHNGDAVAAAAPAAAPAERAETVRRVLVTAAPPTPNGDLHLGHLSGPYLSGDIYTRALRLQGIDAHFVAGSDDNSIYVKAKGQEMGMAPQAAADHFSAAIEETLAAAGIDLAVFPRPNASPHHVPLVQEFFRSLYDRGKLVAKEAPAPYCERCASYLFESAIRGRCPHCGSGVVGNTCEDCGRVNDCVDLVDPACTACGAAPVLRPYRRLVFPLGRYAGALRDYYRRVAMNPHLRALCERVLADGPPDVAVTHPTDWGIEVPVPGWEEQRIYVWLEMAPRYFAYARLLADALATEGGSSPSRWRGTDGASRPDQNGAKAFAPWERWWKAADARVVQFFGFDNSFYYGMLVPALMLAYDPEIRLPAAFVANEFYRLDGSKFSTSRGHRILGRDLLGLAPRDAVRFFLAHTCPEREETNFTLADFDALAAEELLAGWDAWLSDLGERLARDFDGAVPATGDWTGEQRRFYHRLQALLAAAAEAYEAEGFSPQRATRAMSELVREARRFGRGERHWEGVAARSEERRTAIALEALAAKLLGLIAAPVMPELADRLWRGLGFAAGPGDASWAGALDWVPAGQRAARLESPFFPGLREYLAARLKGGGI